MRTAARGPSGPNPPEFDVFVCAGDVLTGDIAMSIEMVAALARGNRRCLSLEITNGCRRWTRSSNPGERRRNVTVHWLELDTVDIGGVRFAGATLWTPLDARNRPSIRSLRSGLLVPVCR